MLSTLTSGASLIVKMSVDGSGKEETIGFVSRLTYSVVNGQKILFTVDSPFPEEIAQGASQSFVRGSMTIYMLRGQTPEAMNMSHFRNDGDGNSKGPLSKYFNLRVYDRQTGGRVLSLDFCKFSGYSVDVASRQLVTATVNFEGMFASPGDGLT